MQEKYDLIGKTYNATRKADSRITKAIIECLKLKENSIVTCIRRIYLLQLPTQYKLNSKVKFPVPAPMSVLGC